MLSRVNPHFKGIDISNRYGLSYLSLLEENMQRAIGSLHISDGTLRFLLLECIFYNTQRGNLVGIDEPERGLHPDMIRSVAEMVKMAARQTQIIAATHSPYLLNQFELEDILVFEKMTIMQQPFIGSVRRIFLSGKGNTCPDKCGFAE